MRWSVIPRAVFLPALTVVTAVGSSGCRSDRLPTEDHLAPPLPAVTATARALGGPNPGLEVSAVVRNPTASHILVLTGPACPLYVRVFPDPTGEYAIAGGPSISCPTSSSPPMIDLAPGDSTRLSRTVPNDSLASYAPGTYGVNLTITIVTSIITVWAGAIDLPIAASP
jgi:hypothetical protein